MTASGDPVMWKRSDGLAIEAPPDERGGNSRLILTPPRHISTLQETEDGSARTVVTHCLNLDGEYPVVLGKIERLLSGLEQPFELGAY